VNPQTGQRPRNDLDALGLDHDSVFADAQDGARFNNANFTLVPDGSRPRLQRFLFTTATPFIDSAYDQEVIIHEYTHGLSGRLVDTVFGVQAGAMGEGWSDWFGMSIFNRPPDNPHGPEVVGEYVTQDFVHGVRRYPYATDMTINPLTYERSLYRLPGLSSARRRGDLGGHVMGSAGQVD